MLSNSCWLNFPLFLWEGSFGIVFIQHQILIINTRSVMEPGEENLYFHIGTARDNVCRIPNAEFKFRTALSQYYSTTQFKRKVAAG